MRVAGEPFAFTDSVRLGRISRSDTVAGDTEDLGDRHTVVLSAGKEAPNLPAYYIAAAQEVFVEQQVSEQLRPVLLARATARTQTGGRQKQADPRLDPRFRDCPDKAARVLRNREAAARTKFRQKLLKEVQKMRRRSSNDQALQHAGSHDAAAGATDAALDPLASLAAVAGLLEHEDAGRTHNSCHYQQQLVPLDDAGGCSADDDSMQAGACLLNAADTQPLMLLQDDAFPRQPSSSQHIWRPSASPELSGGSKQKQQQQLVHKDSRGQESAVCMDLSSYVQPQQPQPLPPPVTPHRPVGGANRRKRSVPAGGAAAAAAAEEAVQASEEQQHRSKRKRHLTAKAVEAAAAGLLPAAAMIPPEFLAEQQAEEEAAAASAAAASDSPSSRYSPTEARLSGSRLAALVHDEVLMMNSRHPEQFLKAVAQLLTLLRLGLNCSTAGDTDTDGAMQLALSGLLQLLDKHSSISSDVLEVLLQVLETLARTRASYQQYMVQRQAAPKLVRLIEASPSGSSVQLRAALMLDSLLATDAAAAAVVGSIAAVGGIEVLLLVVASSRQGSQLRAAAANVLCHMAQLHPSHDEVAIAAAGVMRIQHSWQHPQRHV